MAESSAGDFTVGKIQKTRRHRVAKMYGQQKRNIIHMSSTAYEQDHSAAAPPSSVMNSRRFMGGGPHVGGRTIPRRCLKKLRCIAAKLNIEWQRWVIASDGDAPNAHRSGERVAFHDNQYRVFPGLVAHSVNATRALSVISRICGILLRPGSSPTSP